MTSLHASATFAKKEFLKIVAVAGIGTTLDFFDWNIAAAAAALVWPAIYYPSRDITTSAFYSLAVFILGFFARPVGAFVFGHVGDRMGRKSTMILTVAVMGGGSLGIALTPGFKSWGVAGGYLILVFRLIQGLGVGGEVGGGTSWILEAAVRTGTKWRGFWGSWNGATSMLGTLMGTLAMAIAVAVFGGATNPSFLDYGWRIPFVLGAVLSVVGLLMRLTTQESPMFKELKERKGLERLPAVKALKEMPKTIIYLVMAYFSSSAVLYIAVVFSMSYVNVLSPELASIAPLVVTVGVVVDILIGFIGGILSDVIGRKRTVLLSVFFSMILLVPAFMLINTKSVPLVFLAEILLFVGPGTVVGFLPLFFCECFPTRHRYSGAGMCQGFSATIGAVNPLIMSYILTFFASPLVGWPYMLIPTYGFLILAIIGTLKLPETRGKDLEF